MDVLADFAWRAGKRYDIRSRAAYLPHQAAAGHDEVDTQFDHAGGVTFHILSLKKARGRAARESGATAQRAADGRGATDEDRRRQAGARKPVPPVAIMSKRLPTTGQGPAGANQLQQRQQQEGHRQQLAQ